MAQSLQKTVGKRRPPRVQIQYDVETNGALEKKELPFVVGVMADLTGMPADEMPELSERKFADINRDNFNTVLAKSGARVAFRVPNKLTGEGQLPVELKFTHMDDFSPERIAEQVEPLKDLLDMRRKLEQLMKKMDGNSPLEKELEKILNNTEHRQSALKEIGLDASEGSK